MELTWRTIYDQAVTQFGGQRPGANLEQQIIDQFEQHPARVVDAIGKLGARYTAGTIHSPWPLVLRELQHTPDRDAIVVTDESERARAIRDAETWIRHVGADIDDEHALIRELFGAPELTADIETLERMVATAEGTDLHRLAVLQLERTRREGRQEIAANPNARLHSYDTPELRAQMHAIWCSTQPDPDTEWSPP